VDSSVRAFSRWCFACMVGVDRAEQRLIQTVLPRLFDAHGDHPPYTRLRIDVKTDKAEVLYGGQIAVRAVTRGMPVDKLWLVAKSGTNETRAIMFLAPDKSFFQTLVNLREPTDCFVTDGTARSRKFSVGIRFTPQSRWLKLPRRFPNTPASRRARENYPTSRRRCRKARAWRFAWRATAR